VYVHRIGRTARAGKAGVAVSFLAPREHSRLEAIERMAPEGAIEAFELPETLPSNPCLETAMVTLEINGGRRNKLRPGDLLGALTGEDGIPGSAVGKIDLFEQNGYVAVQAVHAEQALARLNGRGIKGRSFRARLAGRRGDTAHR
jgi:ATP-independent RNA helicase DbpA